MVPIPRTAGVREAEPARRPDLPEGHGELILVHTPHLADKYQGTRMILDMIKGDSRIRPDRVCIDHVEEHTIRPALEAGHWVGMTLYPITKCTPARAADMIEMYGAERVMVNSAGDWGHSDPLAVPEFIFEMRGRDPGRGVRCDLLHALVVSLGASGGGHGSPSGRGGVSLPFIPPA